MMSKPKFSQEEIESFSTDVKKVSAEIAGSLAKLMLGKEKIAIEGVVYGLLKVAGFIAHNTDCPQHVFEKLAMLAYKDEAPKTIDAKLDVILEKKKDLPN